LRLANATGLHELLRCWSAFGWRNGLSQHADQATGKCALARLQDCRRASPYVYVPTFAGDYLGRRLRSKQVWSCSPFDSVTLKTLSAESAWLEQEIFILNKRLLEDIASAFAALPERKVTFLNT
jgi:hypothetical protein